MWQIVVGEVGNSGIVVTIDKMADSDSMDDVGDTEMVDDSTHDQLLSSIFALDGKKRQKKVVRGLPVASGSLDLAVHAKKDTSKIQLGDLNIKPKHAQIELKKPMSSLEVEKAKRQIARDSMQTEMSRWDPVVKEIRAAPQTIYSKRPHGIKMYEAVQPKPFTPRTPLEKELYEALGKSEDVLRPNQELTEAEAKALKAMSIKEAKARRAELMKHHELLSRMEQKAKRQKKIKSKRYRKILRMEKVSTEKKELEQLQKTDPEAFLEKLESMERARMEERLTLKHRGGGKFSKMHKAYSKFDDKTRQAMQDMLQKSRELTKKREGVSSSDDESDNNQDDTISHAFEKNNAEDDSEEEDDETQKANNRAKQLNMLKAVNKKAGGWLDGPKTTYVYTDAQNEEGKIAGGTHSDSEPSTSQKVFENVGDNTRKNVDPSSNKNDASGELTKESEDQEMSDIKDAGKTAPKLSQKLKSSATNNVSSDESDVNLKNSPVGVSGKRKATENDQSETDSPKKKKKRKRKKKKTDDNVDISGKADVKDKPVKETVLHTPVDDDNDDENNSDDGMKVTMEELFQDEDVVEEFAREKAEAEERRRPKIEDTKLPGWGGWAGPDYKQKQEKQKQKKKVTGKAKRLQNDQQKVKQPHVWLNPNRDDSIRKLQPKTVPFPFSSVQQYEASLRHPVSRGFVRETAFKLLTKPEVVTKLGHIIKPLDKDDYFKEKDLGDNSDDGFETQKKDKPDTTKRKVKPKRRGIR